MTDVELDSNFLIEERADYIDEDTIKNNTIRTGEFFDIIDIACFTQLLSLTPMWMSCVACSYLTLLHHS
ncbi:hypothetical protein J4W30_12155 [Escherichia coli]